MSSRILTKMSTAAGAIVLTAGLTSGISASAAYAASSDLECANSVVQKTLKNGATWRMCVRIHPVKGLVLEKIEFKPATGSYEYEGFRRVLDQIYLSQLNVPYDMGTTFNDITAYGFGKDALVAQTSRLCPGEMLDVTQSYLYGGQMIERTVPGICTQEAPTGVTTHSAEGQAIESARFVDQGTALEVSSLSKISWYEYLQRFTFDDQGKIDIGLGATGDLAPGSGGFYSSDPADGWPIGPSQDDPQLYSAAHRHNAIYRVDFGIDEGAQQAVEQWDYANPHPEIDWIIKGTRATKGQAFSSVPGTEQDAFTWWRVLNPISLNKDGHARSYEIVNKNHGDKYTDFTKPTVSFTNDHACQEYASDNLNPECPGLNVLDYVASETAPLTDPVAWVNVGFHHIPRDEDQSPMPMHWQSFQLVPRDFFAQSPSTPEARRCINGTQLLGSYVSVNPCGAVNISLPRITANAAGIVVGTKLTASSGSWNTGRTTWDYSYLWFRDGQPIVEPEPAVDQQHFVTAADVGRTITVKVTASRLGYTSGTAESAPLLIPGGATSPPGSTASPVPPGRASVSSTSSGRLVRSKVTTRQNAKVRVTVTSTGVAPSGRVQIRHGSKVLKTGTVSGGRATITLPKLKKARAYRLRVVFLGSSTTKLSTSRPFTLRVVKR